ncbi:MAG: hypothetical protein ABH823_03955 [bacterium]
MTMAGLLDSQSLHLPFTMGDLRKEELLRTIFLPVNNGLTIWSREFVNRMPEKIKVKIFKQKLQAIADCRLFLASHPELELTGVMDYSSGRFFDQRSIYRLTFRNRQNGEVKDVIVKPPFFYADGRKAAQSEVFYSQYLQLFERNPASIEQHGDYAFIEFVAGQASSELAIAGIFNEKYRPFVGELIVWFAQEAALADAVNKGDRDFGFSGKPFGNYIIVFDEDEKEIERIVSVDHQFIFNSADEISELLLKDASRGHVEMSLLAVLPEFSDLARREDMQATFTNAYAEMLAKIRGRRDVVVALIKRWYGDEQVELFEANLLREPNNWLREMLARTEELADAIAGRRF